MEKMEHTEMGSRNIQTTIPREYSTKNQQMDTRQRIYTETLGENTKRSKKKQRKK